MEPNRAPADGCGPSRERVGALLAESSCGDQIAAGPRGSHCSKKAPAAGEFSAQKIHPRPGGFLRPTPARLDRARFRGDFLRRLSRWPAVVPQKDLVVKLNGALREGKYDSDMWKTLTGKTVDELNDEWKAALDKGPGK